MLYNFLFLFDVSFVWITDVVYLAKKKDCWNLRLGFRITSVLIVREIMKLKIQIKLRIYIIFVQARDCNLFSFYYHVYCVVGLYKYIVVCLILRFLPNITWNDLVVSLVFTSNFLIKINIYFHQFICIIGGNYLSRKTDTQFRKSSFKVTVSP